MRSMAIYHNVILCALLIIPCYDSLRVKRDDASFASNFGGPVAKNVQPEEPAETVTGSAIYTAPVETSVTQPPSPPPSSAMISPTPGGLAYGTRPPVLTPAPSRFSVPPQYVPPGCRVEHLPQKILAMLLQERDPPPHIRRRRSPKHDGTLDAYLASAGGRGRESYLAAPVAAPSVSPLPFAAYPVPASAAYSPLLLPEPTAATPCPMSSPATATPPSRPSTAGPTSTLVPFEKLDVGKYVLLASRYCVDLQECFRFCKDFQCNYMLRSSQSNVVYLYKVFPTQLNNGKFQDYPDHESYAIICAEQPTLSAVCLRLKSYDEYVQEFEKFTTTYQKVTYDTAERQRVFEYFSDNSQIVQKLNCERRRSTDAYFELNEFSDLTFEQFLAVSGSSLYPLSEQKPAKQEIYGRGQQLIKKCPKWNWMDAGVVSQPRRQGKCGSCYAFSTADLVAAQYQIDRRLKSPFELSPQFLIDCAKSPAGLGCDGGRPIEVLRNLTQCTAQSGCNFPLETCYSYKEQKGVCRNQPCQSSPLVKVHWATLINASGLNEKETIASLLHWGPIVAIVDANQAWQFYSGSGIISPHQCSKNQNHAVLIVGYDFTGPVPFYSIKNSWGSKWGDKGFVRLEAGRNTCGVARNLAICCTHDCENLKKDINSFASRLNSFGCSSSSYWKKKFS